MLPPPANKKKGKAPFVVLYVERASEILPGSILKLQMREE